MAIVTLVGTRNRSEIKILTGATLAAAEAAYAAYEATKAGDATKSWSVGVIVFFLDAGTYYILAYASYPETNIDNLLPIIPPGV
jgi:hypothetical protein